MSALDRVDGFDGDKLKDWLDLVRKVRCPDNVGGETPIDLGLKQGATTRRS